MAVFGVVTLMKTLSCNYRRPTHAAPGETLGSGLPDRTIAVLQCRFLSWEHRLWSRAGRQRHEVERLRLARSFKWRCQAMPGRQVLRCVMPGRQVLRTTDLSESSRLDGHAGRWRRGVVTSTVVWTGKDDADLYPEDGSVAR